MDERKLAILLAASLEDARLSRREKQDLRQFIADEVEGPQDFLKMHACAIDVARDFPEASTFNWLKSLAHLIEREAEKSPGAKNRAPTLLFSPQDDCPARLQDLIRDARESILICVFTITDDVVSKEIIRAHRRGIEVRVVSDNEKALDLGSDIKKLVDSGIPVALDLEGHMHHKFAVFDHKTSLTGSYNWTRSAARYNHENMLISWDSETADALTGEFEMLWRLYGGNSQML